MLVDFFAFGKLLSLDCSTQFDSQCENKHVGHNKKRTFSIMVAHIIR